MLQHWKSKSEDKRKRLWWLEINESEIIRTKETDVKEFCVRVCLIIKYYIPEGFRSCWV